MELFLLLQPISPAELECISPLLTLDQSAVTICRRLSIEVKGNMRLFHLVVVGGKKLGVTFPGVTPLQPTWIVNFIAPKQHQQLSRCIY